MTKQSKLNKMMEALRHVIELIRPHKVILFGSHARGTATAESDIDLMIVVDKFEDQELETRQIYKTLWNQNLYADVVVVTKDHFDYWKGTTNHICNEALLDGKILYEKTA